MQQRLARFRGATPTAGALEYPIDFSRLTAHLRFNQARSVRQAPATGPGDHGPNLHLGTDEISVRGRRPSRLKIHHRLLACR